MSSYSLWGSASIVQVLSPTVSEDMVQVTIETNPSGVFATTLVSQVSFNTNQAADQLTAFADAIEAIMSQGKAVGGTPSSKLDANGLQAFYVTFTVAYNPPNGPQGTITADVDVPVGLLDQADAEIGRTLQGEAEALIDAAYNSLVSMAGG